MTESGNRGPNDPSFRRGGRKRREPPLIEGAATEMAATDLESGEPGVTGAASDPAEDQPALSAMAEEPVLFGGARRDAAARSEGGLSPEEPQRPVDASGGPSESVAPRVSPAFDATAEAGRRESEAPEPDLGAASLTAAQPAMPPPPSSPPARRWKWGVLPALLGAVILGLLGSIGWLLWSEPQRTRSDELAGAVDEIRTRLAALEGRPDPVAKVQGSIDALNTRVGALTGQEGALRKQLADIDTHLEVVDGRVRTVEVQAEAARAAAVAVPTPSPQDEPKSAPDAPSRADLASLQDRVSDLGQRLDRLPPPSPPAPAVDLAPLDGKVGDLERQVAALRGTLAALPKTDLGPLQAAAAGLDRRLKIAEAALSAPKIPDRVTEARVEGSSDDAKAAPRAVVAQAVLRALDEGRPYGMELDALRALGADPERLRLLEKPAAEGAPTVLALKGQWDATRGEILAAGRPKAEGGVLDRLASGARGLVQVRRVGTSVGGGNDAAVARIDDALEHSDLAAAVAAWDALPAADQDRSRAWGDAARRRLEAVRAAQALMTSAMAAIARPRG